MDVTSILWVSVGLQLIAAVMALRLIPITGRTLAWSILSAAFILMATRRAISLLNRQGLIENEVLTVLSAEVVALTISALIVIGVFLIRNVFVQKRHHEDELRKLSQVVEQNANSTIITDLDGRIEYVNQKFTETTGYSLSEIKGKTPSFLRCDKTPADTFSQMWKALLSGKTWNGELCNRTRQGNERWQQARMSQVKDAEGNVTHYVSVFEDITEQKAQREALEYMAMHDALTDLPNRALFYDRVYQAILNAEHNETSSAVVLIDLNQFKVINDTLGHHIGDKILKEVANRLQSGIKGFDTVARMGGDEYLVLLSEVTEQQAVHISERLVRLVREPFDIQGQNFDIGMSIGIAMYPQHGDDPDQLIQRADVAMYTAKSLRSGIAVYDPEQDNYSVGRLELLGEMRQALDEGQFCLYYQPRINLASEEVVGAEVLIRWNHPRRGMIYPDQFIPLLEETGHITILTRWILNKAIEQLAEWAEIQPGFLLSINISTRDLCNEGMATYLQGLLDEYGMDPDSIILELTESSLMQYSRYTQSTLELLEDMGIRLAIDDFGTGYSSLQYLKVLPVHELKIDKSFVMHMMEDEDDAVIVRSIIDLGHNLGLEVIAEGVEDDETAKLLQILHCNSAQGYYYSRPVSTAVLQSMLEGPKNVIQLELAEQSI